jgi:excisionase family DNA binding protein
MHLSIFLEMKCTGVIHKSMFNTNSEGDGRAPVGSNQQESRLPKLAYSPAEAAVILGVCRDSVYRLIKRGLLRSSSAFRHKVIPHVEIERFLKSTLS